MKSITSLKLGAQSTMDKVTTQNQDFPRFESCSEQIDQGLTQHSSFKHQDSICESFPQYVLSD